jgi:hypothetical protein
MEGLLVCAALLALLALFTGLRFEFDSAPVLNPSGVTFELAQGGA